MRVRGGVRLFLWIWMGLGSGWASGAGQDDLSRRLSELEARLERLEEENQRLRAGRAAQAEDAHTVEVEELRRQLGIVASEMEKLRSGEQELEVTDREARALGLGPSAASVYRKPEGASLAGYGEMIYENFAGSDQSGAPVDKGSQLDFLRLILYTGYRFDEKFLFNSEVEFEHASTDQSGSASVEFAYIDYLASPHLALRGGLLLIPMGLTNEFHEPNVFFGSKRPVTETQIIPTTWRENGFGLVGSAGMFDYRAYLVNGLNAGKFSASGLRGGRQKGSKARASNLAFVGRLDVTPTPGVSFGASLYHGGSGQSQFEVDEEDLELATTIFDIHGRLQTRGLDVRGLFARAEVGDALELNQALDLAGTAAIGESLQGGYLQVGYNLLSQFREEAALSPYYRFEKVNTQNQVPQGFTRDPARDGIFHTLGLEFKPISGVVIKSDYQWNRNEAQKGVSQFNLGLGYSF